MSDPSYEPTVIIETDADYKDARIRELEARVQMLEADNLCLAMDVRDAQMKVYALLTDRKRVHARLKEKVDELLALEVSFACDFISD